jgi:hypothetical protein
LGDSLDHCCSRCGADDVFRTSLIRIRRSGRPCAVSLGCLGGSMDGCG